MQYTSKTHKISKLKKNIKTIFIKFITKLGVARLSTRFCQGTKAVVSQERGIFCILHAKCQKASYQTIDQSAFAQFRENDKHDANESNEEQL